MVKKILVIEDDMDMSLLLKRFLTKNGFDVTIAANGNKGVNAFTENIPDLVLCDYRLGDMDGNEILQKLRNVEPNVPVIIMTGYSDIRTAVNVMKSGAFDYLAKPLLPDETLQLINKALNSPQRATGVSALNDNVNDSDEGSSKKAPKLTSIKGNYIFGKSPQSKELLRQIDLVAPTNYSVIIYGESGAGKEAIAQMIHKKSKRAKEPFVAMDCGAISKELAGSELFGHEKGSFTGAIGTKIGHFELANGGTLFLDEVANLPYDIQSSLLRVVQERKVKRIGGTKEIILDVRILVASNENLAEAAKKGKFREDLYHRFNEFHMQVHSLRERKGEVEMYADFFLKSANAELEKNIESFSEEVKTIFNNYPWYGNLREMKNIIRRAVLLTDGEIIESQSLPAELKQFLNSASENTTSDDNSIEEKEMLSEANVIPEERREEVKDNKPDLKSAALVAEYDVILKVLKQVNFNKSKAARILNIDRKTLYNKMKAYDLEA